MYEARITVEKSFDSDTNSYSKKWESKDIEEFLRLEGSYIDKLIEHVGKEHEDLVENNEVLFTINYSIKITKREEE